MPWRVNWVKPCTEIYIFCVPSLVKAHTRGSVPATSACIKSRGQVPSCELATFASKYSRRDHPWSLRLVSRIQNSLNFWDKSLRLVPQNTFVWTVHGRSPSDQSLRVNSSGDLLQGLVAGTSPLVCAGLNGLTVQPPKTFVIWMASFYEQSKTTGYPKNTSIVTCHMPRASYALVL